MIVIMIVFWSYPLVWLVIMIVSWAIGKLLSYFKGDKDSAVVIYKIT